MFKALFEQNSSKRHAHALYGVVVAKSRDAAFFEKYAIPDTFDGRFEMLVIHLFILHARLKDEELPARKISQLVFDNFISDMDSALREAGVGDQTLPKRLAKMTQVFYGRTGAFEVALEARKPLKELSIVVARNLFPEGDTKGKSPAIAAYMLEQVRKMADMSVEEITHGHAIYGASSK